jgi:hypothetical protein
MPYQPENVPAPPVYRVRIKDWFSSKDFAGSVHTAHSFLSQLSEYRRELLNSTNPRPNWRQTWLIPFRDEFRALVEHGAAPVIARHLLNGDRELRALHIWLLSQFADRYRLISIDRFASDPSPVVRKHVAKALRRLGAWHQLDLMAKANPENDRIQWFAFAPTTTRGFTERLQSFKVHVDDSHKPAAHESSRMEYWSLHKPWQGNPPKSIQFIRNILLRIRQILRGNGHAH